MASFAKIDFTPEDLARIEPLVGLGLQADEPRDAERATGPLFDLLGRVFNLSRGVFLAGASLAGACLALSGFMLLSWLLLTRWLTHAATHWERPVFFDYSQPRVEGGAAFVGDAGANEGLLPYTVNGEAATDAGRFLQPGDVVGVWLELQLASELPPTPIFQVVAELQSLDGRVAARISRPFKHQEPAQQRGVVGRLMWRMYRPAMQVLSVPLFDAYVEKQAIPTQVVRVAMVGRNGNGAVPEATAAALHVQLQLGLIGRLLYKLRPGAVSLLLLAPLGAAALLGGSGAALGSALLLLYLWRRAGRGARGTGSSTYTGSASTAGSEAPYYGRDSGDGVGGGAARGAGVLPLPRGVAHVGHLSPLPGDTSPEVGVSSEAGSEGGEGYEDGDGDLGGGWDEGEALTDAEDAHEHAGGDAAARSQGDCAPAKGGARAFGGGGPPAAGEPSSSGSSWGEAEAEPGWAGEAGGAASGGASNGVGGGGGGHAAHVSGRGLVRRGGSGRLLPAD